MGPAETVEGDLTVGSKLDRRKNRMRKEREKRETAAFEKGVDVAVDRVAPMIQARVGSRALVALLAVATVTFAAGVAIGRGAW